MQRRELGQERLRANPLPTPGGLPFTLVQRELFDAQIADEPVERCRTEGNVRSTKAQRCGRSQAQQGFGACRLPAAEGQLAQHAVPTDRRSRPRTARALCLEAAVKRETQFAAPILFLSQPKQSGQAMLATHPLDVQINGECRNTLHRHLARRTAQLPTQTALRAHCQLPVE